MPRRHARPTQDPQDADKAPEPLPSQSAQALIDPYAVLGIPRKAGLDDIKRAYFTRVREFPPERDPEMFKKIRAAYDMLRTPEAKAATDLFMPHPPVPYAGSKRPPVFDLDFQASDWATLIIAFSDLGRTDFRSDFREVEV